MSEKPLVSVVISNYNYKDFLEEAVDSALNQTYSKVEVVVVDDGSTDDSRATIASYGARIVSLLRDNGGQASACNAGFRVSGGEIVTFLDADDVLLPDTLERVVAAFRSRPKAAKVQYRQLVVDARGKLTGELEPPARRPMPSGDLRKRMLELNDYIWPPTSGNAFAAEVLRRIMPIPEGLCRGTPDLHLCQLSAMFGEVISLREPGTLYRVHGRNNYLDPTRPVNLGLLRKVLLAIEHNHMSGKRLFATLYGVDTRTIGPRDIYFLCGRMVSLRLDPRGHPFGGETLWKLFLRGCALSISYPDPEMGMGRRVLYLLWFATMLLSSKSLARFGAEVFFGTGRKGWLHTTLVSFMRRIR